LRGDLLGHVEHGAGVEAEEVGDDGNHYSADAKSAPDHAHPPPILDVAASPLLA
jgi:hypothetical protein